MIRGSCLLGALLVLAAPATAQDRTVAAALDREGITYEVDGDGDYKIIWGFTDDDRTQLVFVTSATESVDLLAVREVLAPVAISPKPFDLATLTTLMRANSELKLGAYRLVQGDGSQGIWFAVHLPASANDSQLRSAIELVAAVADLREKELTGKDDY